MIVSKIEGIKPKEEIVVKTIKIPINRFLIEGYFVAETCGIRVTIKKFILSCPQFF